MISDIDIKKWIKEWENPVIDFKRKEIISDNHKIAKLMVAFGNNKYVSEDFGGRIIIGVTNTKEIEGIAYDSKHEEHIMNIARDKCYPSINPIFQTVQVDDKTVYVITIPKMLTVPYQQITKEGNVHWIRVGTTIRQPSFNELSQLYGNTNQSTQNVEKLSIIRNLPRQYDAYRRIIVLPIDTNAKIINFDKTTTDFIRNNIPSKFFKIQDIIVKQNELHYYGKKREKDHKCYGILDNLGNFCFEELLDIFDREIKKIIIGREIIFLYSWINHIDLLYKKIGYSGRIKINYRLQSVEKYVLTEGDTQHIWWEDHICLLPEVNIERVISLSTLHDKELISFILEEIARACNWPLDNGFFDKYVNEIVKKYF